jgi:DNA-binding CsgD family transcriptional regulator
VFVISGRGRLIIRNPAADALLSAGTLVLHGERLGIESGATIIDQRWLQRTAGATDGVVDGLRPLHIQVPTRTTESRMFATAQRLDADVWMITVHLTGKRRPPCTVRLKQLLGLTPAESRLVAELFVTAGRLDDVAAVRGITHETARSQLRSVFRKCEVGSQAELVRLVASGPFF